MKSASILIALLMLIPALAIANEGRAVTTLYYYGKVDFRGPDGKTPYGQTTSLVKRTVDPEAKSITELVTQPDRQNPKVYNDFLTVMTLKSGTTFDTRDEGDTFSGSLTFSGPEWQWDQWSYDIDLKGGGKIVGIGALDSNGIVTHKRVLGPDGNVSVFVDESLPPISQEQYESYRKVMSPSAKP